MTLRKEQLLDRCSNVQDVGEEADIDMHVARGGVNFYF